MKKPPGTNLDSAPLGLLGDPRSEWHGGSGPAMSVPEGEWNQTERRKVCARACVLVRNSWRMCQAGHVGQRRLETHIDQKRPRVNLAFGSK